MFCPSGTKFEEITKAPEEPNIIRTNIINKKTKQHGSGGAKHY